MSATLKTAFVALQFYAMSSILISVLQGAGFTKHVFAIEFISVGIYVVVAYALTLVWTQPIDVIWRADWVYFLVHDCRFSRSLFGCFHGKMAIPL